MSHNMAPINSNGIMQNYSTHPSSPTSTPSSLTPTSMEDPLIKKDDESEPTSPSNDTPKKAGRRKIKIEFIDDKSRRHITFSKRKAGIMKKAYELSTLTGTQVLLLVASETGHVYTFATSKLQPLITRPEGKNLIQSCLNTPDAPTSPPLISSANNSNANNTTTPVSLQVATTPPRMGQSSISQQQQHQQQLQQQVQQQVQQQQANQLQQQYSDSLLMAAYNDSLYGSNNDQEKEDRRSLGGMSKDQKGNYINSQNMDMINGYNSGYQNGHIINTLGGYYPTTMNNSRGYPLNGSASSSPASPTQYTYPHSMIGQYPSQ